MDVWKFKTDALELLLDSLDEIHGLKSLFIDRDLNQLISSIAPFSTLKKTGFSFVHWLHQDSVESSESQVVFIVRPTLDSAKHIKRQCQRLSKSNRVEEFTVFCLPENNALFQSELANHELNIQLSLRPLPIYWLPLTDDVLSFQLDCSFKELFLDHDTSLAFYCASAIESLELQYGVIPYVMGIGNLAQHLASLIKNSSNQEDQNRKPRIYSSEISALFILDRSVDFLTPLFAQLNYEGLLMEHFQYEGGHFVIPAEIIGLKTNETSRKMPLDYSNVVFNVLKDLPFPSVGEALNAMARKLYDNYEDQRDTTKKSSDIQQLLSHVKLMKEEHSSLKFQTSLAEEALLKSKTEPFSLFLNSQQEVVSDLDSTQCIETIEQLVGMKAPLHQVLRLCCILALTQCGVKEKYYEFLRNLICRGYGFEHINTIHLLNKLKLFYSKKSTTLSSKILNRSPFTQTRDIFRLSDAHENNEDSTFVCGTYAPLSVRLVQCAFQPSAVNIKSKSQNSTYIDNWEESSDATQLICDYHVSVKQQDDSGFKKPVIDVGETIIILYLGGITSGEITALRAVSKKIKKKFVIVTTSVLTGEQVMQAVIS